jgi:beta-lactamase regulating signal transducer with metallopeptidase domain
MRSGEIRQQWTRFTEWAADDWAVQQDASRSTSLASALVNVARLGIRSEPSLASSLISSEPDELRERVERLLEPKPHLPASPRPLVGSIAIAACVIAILAFNQPTVHRWLELLIG